MTNPVELGARRELADAERVARHDAAVFDLRTRRDAAAAEVPDWEALREQAAAVKAHTLDHLDTYLEEFEAQASQAGAVIHWAADATALQRIVGELLEERGVQRVVKSKSMLTEECELNPHLEARGIHVVDTDLGERIVQLRGERPSHIILPAIHRSREDIGELFHRHLGTARGETDPARLTRAARRDLRSRFLAAQAAITGVNFAVAETGSIVVVTNEGNADLGMSLPRLHVACLGIEKLIPQMEDLPVFLRLLARSATGQPISAYTSIVTGPRPGAELHIVLVDNGRTALLARKAHRSALACIRCGACLNTCPVYRRSGGHAFPGPIPGPIGSVLAPAMRADGAALPHASSLCGSCTAVCPVRIDLHDQLLAWRRETIRPWSTASLSARLAARVMARPGWFRFVGGMARGLWPVLSRRFPGNPAGGWLRTRALPPHPGPSFSVRWRRERGQR